MKYNMKTKGNTSVPIRVKMETSGEHRTMTSLSRRLYFYKSHNSPVQDWGGFASLSQSKERSRDVTHDGTI